MKELLLGIDVGTSACKAAAFAPDGTVAAQASEPYPVYYPQQGWAEQDPGEWWRAVCKAVRALLEKGGIAPGEILGVGVDGQSWSAIPVDGQGRVLCNTPIWMDTRSREICGEIARRVDPDRLFQVSGNPLQPAYTLPKILWYKKHRPQVYERADKILQSALSPTGSPASCPRTKARVTGFAATICGGGSGTRPFAASWKLTPASSRTSWIVTGSSVP